MAVLHITEADLIRDAHAILERVRAGAEIIIDEEHRPLAIIKSAAFQGRSIDECIALVQTHGSHTTLDDAFPQDLEEIVASHRESLRSSWD